MIHLHHYESSSLRRRNEEMSTLQTRRVTKICWADPLVQQSTAIDKKPAVDHSMADCFRFLNIFRRKGRLRKAQRRESTDDLQKPLKSCLLHKNRQIAVDGKDDSQDEMVKFTDSSSMRAIQTRSQRNFKRHAHRLPNKDFQREDPLRKAKRYYIRKSDNSWMKHQVMTERFLRSVIVGNIEVEL